MPPSSPLPPLALHAPGWIDYYDHWFETKGEGVALWNRNGRSFPLRREGFWSMAKAGVACVPNGTVREMALQYPKAILVVYTDEREHQGQGKELVAAQDAAQTFPDHWCSLYVPLTPAGARAGTWAWEEELGEPTSVSLRLLRVGSLGFAIAYRSKDDWRSNNATDEIKVVNHRLLDDKAAALTALMVRYRSPLLAIDVIPNEQGAWLATDFNLAPGMRGTGLNDVLPAKQAVQAIKEFYFAHCMTSP